MVLRYCTQDPSPKRPDPNCVLPEQQALSPAPRRSKQEMASIKHPLPSDNRQALNKRGRLLNLIGYFVCHGAGVAKMTHAFECSCVEQAGSSKGRG